MRAATTWGQKGSPPGPCRAFSVDGYNTSRRSGSAGGGVDVTSQDQVVVGDTPGVVAAHAEGDGPPTDVDVRVVVHRLGQLRDRGDQPDPIHEGAFLHAADQSVVDDLPLRQVVADR